VGEEEEQMGYAEGECTRRGRGRRKAIGQDVERSKRDNYDCTHY
jgi:hypothetical protein